VSGGGNRANLGGFLLSVSLGYFVKLFGSYHLPLIPIALMLRFAV